MRELAYIQKIKSLSPIVGADKIEKAEVLGWELVVKKGEFNVGDLCVYCEIDSVFPDIPPFEFLRSKKFRIKTIKLKNQISQGIAFSTSILAEVDPAYKGAVLKVGQDVTEALGITKYDPEASSDIVPEQEKKSWLANKYSFLKWKLTGIKPVKRGSFPSDVPKTDEIRVQKMGTSLEQREGYPIYITEKLEGSSATFIHRKVGNWFARFIGTDYSFQICSRNTTVFNSDKGNSLESNAHALCRIAEKYSIMEKMKDLDRNLAVQGESIGGKIQGNIYKLPELDFRVFLIFDIDNKKYLSLYETALVCDRLGLTMVPVITWLDLIRNDIKYYVELSKGKSMLNPNILREGIVIRGLNDNFSFKSINPEYLLKQD